LKLSQLFATRALAGKFDIADMPGSLREKIIAADQ